MNKNMSKAIRINLYKNTYVTRTAVTKCFALNKKTANRLGGHIRCCLSRYSYFE